MGFWHGLYDYDLYQRLHENNCTYEYLEFQDPSDECLMLLDEFETFVDRINIYSVYHKCLDPGPKLFEPKKKQVKVGDQIKEY